MRTQPHKGHLSLKIPSASKLKLKKWEKENFGAEVESICIVTWVLDYGVKLVLHNTFIFQTLKRI